MKRLWILGGIVCFFMIDKFVRIRGSHSHSHSHSEKKSNKKENGKGENKKGEKKKETNNEEGGIKVTAWLNLAADFSHNFTDGLAIGVSYLTNQKLGYITTFAILLHEIPHEIGDFAILVQSGCSKKKAMLLQFTTAIGALGNKKKIILFLFFIFYFFIFLFFFFI